MDVSLSVSLALVSDVIFTSNLQETELEIEEEIDILMSSDIVSAQMSTTSITFSRAQQGWFFRSDRKVSTHRHDNLTRSSGYGEFNCNHSCKLSI